MNEKANLTAIAHDRTALVNRVRELETENNFLREAAKHFFQCPYCQKDSGLHCPEGHKCATILGFYSANRKAV